MKSSHRISNRAFTLAALALALTLFAALGHHASAARNSAKQTTRQTPALQGRAALQQLNQRGLSASLLDTLTTTNVNLLTKITAPDAEPDSFGYAVAASGDTLAIGAFGDDIGGNANQGSVYVFVRTGTSYTLQQKLTASDGATNSEFGNAVALSGDTLVIGAHGDDHQDVQQQGAAYVFVRSGAVWSQQQKLTADDGAAQDYFGRAVALSGETVVVGAPSDDIGSNLTQGSAYVFTRAGVTWSQQQKLRAGDGAAGDYFGRNVALNGNTALVGAQNDDTGAVLNHGAAYVFVRSGASWSQQQKLTAGDGAPEDNFGTSVALNGNTAAITARQDDILGIPNQGSLYLFTRTGTSWSQQQKLSASDSGPNKYFGTSLAFSTDGATLLCGAEGDAIGGHQFQGSAYVFTRSGATYSQQQKLTANDGGATNYFGYAVALSGETAVVGAYNHSNSRGAVYVYEPPLNNAPTLTAAAVTRTQGALSGSSPIATASDIEDPETALSVTVNGGPNASANGVSVSGLTVNAAGIVNAIVGAGCNATSAAFTLRVTDSGGAFAETTLNVTVNPNPPPVLSYASPQTVLPGAAKTISPASGPSDNIHVAALVVHSVTPAFGGVINVNGAGVVTIANATPAGSFTVTIRATDNCGAITNAVFMLNVNPVCGAIIITPASLAVGLREAPYNQTLTASGGTAPYAFSLTGGALPAGLTLAPNGLLAGTPTVGGAFNFNVNVVDANNCGGAKAYALNIANPIQPQPATAKKGDFDGDGKADLAVWTGATGNWTVSNSSNASWQTTLWGAGFAPFNDVIVPGDYDGDGKLDHAIWRGADSIWYIRKSSNGQALVDLWGANYAPYFDVPQPSDFDGDGKTDLAVWRPSTGTWYVKRSSDHSTLIEVWGQSGDTPVAADYDGDGKVDFAYWRPSDGTWNIKKSSGGTQSIAWGAGYAPYFDVPVVADYDGDGKADCAIWRGQDSLWYIRPSASPGNPVTQLWGANYAPYNDVPVPGDYDGDGRADIAVWRPTNATWYVFRSSNGTSLVQPHGQNGDTPVPAHGIK